MAYDSAHKVIQGHGSPTLFHAHSTKAGLPSDQASHLRVAHLIEQAAHGSKYSLFQEKKRNKISLQCKELAAKIRSIEQRSPDDPLSTQVRNQVDSYMKQSTTFTEQCLKTAETCRIYAHFDMDAFFASVEIRESPHLSTLPIAVGSSSMLCTANYVARAYGVSSAMPGYIAKRLCPDIIIIAPHYAKYKAASQTVMSALREYDPLLNSYSVDEASLDLTDYLKNQDLSAADASTLVFAIRERIYELTGLTCSAGISYSRRLAKMLSNVNKPNGQFSLPVVTDLEATQKWLRRQSIRRLRGVGKVSSQILSEGYQVSTCEQLIDKKYVLAELSSDWKHLLAAAHGLFDSNLALSKHEEEVEGLSRKSLSVDRTIKPTDTPEALIEHLMKIAIGLEAAAHKQHVHGLTLTLKLRSVDFQNRSKSRTFSKYMNTHEDFVKYGTMLLHSCLPCHARLIGLRLSHLIASDLLSSENEAKAKIPFYLHKEQARQANAEPTIGCSVCGEQRFEFHQRLVLAHHEKECQLKWKKQISQQERPYLGREEAPPTNKLLNYYSSARGKATVVEDDHALCKPLHQLMSAVSTINQQQPRSSRSDLRRFFPAR